MTARECVFFFCGVDPAPSESQKSDDGAIVCAAATPRQLPTEAEGLPKNPEDWHFDLIYARRLTWREKATTRQWAGLLHVLHRAFRFARMCIDPNSGGTMIMRELRSPKQLINGVETLVTPIADFVDGPRLLVLADFILHMWKRGDPGVEAVWPNLAGDDVLNDMLYSTTKSALESASWGWTAPVGEVLMTNDEIRGGSTSGLAGLWNEERVWALKCLDAMATQFANVLVATKEDGTILFTKRNMRMFSAKGKKDLVSAGMYAYMAFLMWLKSDDLGTPVAQEDEVAFSGVVRTGR